MTTETVRFFPPVRKWFLMLLSKRYVDSAASDLISTVSGQGPKGVNHSDLSVMRRRTSGEQG
jgi:hypothetical protein